MGEDIVERFDRQLAFEGELRVEWAAPDSQNGDEDLSRLRDANLTVLNLVAAVEEHRAEVFDDDAPSGAELGRLDAKINLLLELVQLLVVRDREPPPRREVRLNAHGIALAADDLYAAPGARIRVRIHLDACRAMPLEFPARAIALGERGRVLLAFEEPGAAIEEAMDRLVFRYHRRKVAIERRAVRGEG